MTLNLRQILGLVLVSVALLDFNVAPPKPDVPRPTIDVVIPEVQDDRKAVLADFYLALGEIVLSDGLSEDPLVSDTEAFSRLHAAALRFAVDRKDVGTVPGLAEAIDKAFFDALGDEVKPLDAGVRAKLAEVCSAIAWSISNG